MLRIGLTGGIGAGKSTVAATFSECGGIVVDGDVIAREVVEPGTEGLAALVEAFGSEILLPDGALNRPALAAIAFPDDEKRATLNGIVHPLVGKRRAELIEAAPDDAVIVEDIPLLVESQMAPMFPLVVIVHADLETRVTRLVGACQRPTRAPGPRRRPPRSSGARSPTCGWTTRAPLTSWQIGLASCGTSGSGRSRTTSRRAKRRASRHGWCRPTRRGRTRRDASWRG
jgi:dephospho-CoA kinase